jgi:hypothetical protein
VLDWAGVAATLGIAAAVLGCELGVRWTADWLLTSPEDDERTALGYELVAGVPNVVGLSLVLVGLGYDLAAYLYRSELGQRDNFLSRMDDTSIGLVTLGAAGIGLAVALALYCRIIIVERRRYVRIMDDRCKPDANFGALSNELAEGAAEPERRAIFSVGTVAVVIPTVLVFVGI